MSDDEVRHCCGVLGVAPGASAEALQKAYVQRSYALIRRGASEAERAELRAAHAALTAGRESRSMPAGAAPGAMAPPSAAPEPAAPGDEPPRPAWYDPTSFDSWRVNALAPLLVIGLAVLIKRSPLGFLLHGFQVWIHEFGHATVAWLTGYRALPLPIGWTSVGGEKSLFVYCGVLFLLGVMFVAGARERKIWPMILAAGGALLQAHLTWRLPAGRAEMWQAFGGVGGEFYLSAAAVALFYVRLPEKFRWGGCRYFFLFIGGGGFVETWLFWRAVKRGAEGIPYGSMIHGEEDGGGDMNTLHDGFGWTQREIIHTYDQLGDACLAALLVVYVIFALRLDKLPARWLQSRG